MSEKVKEMVWRFYQENPYIQHLGIDIVSIEAGCARLKLTVNHEHTNTYAIAHGGALMSMADTAMGAVCLSINKKVVTLDMNMNLMKAVPEDKTIYAVGRILHDGARTIVAECDIVDEGNTLYGRARGTFFVLDPFLLLALL